MSNFFDVHEGSAHDTMATKPMSLLRDATCDLLLALKPSYRQIDAASKSMIRQKILVVGVEVPARGNALNRITRQLVASRHDVIVSTVPMKPKGKFENVDEAIRAAKTALDDVDWLMIIDDDVALPKNFTDDYIAAASLADVVVSQPAHRFLSYATYQITRRRPGNLVRMSRFVEIGPLTVIRKEAFSALLPFPPSRWAYGIDILWADICRRNGWRMGIVDAVSIRHLKPVGGGYNMDDAIVEGRALLERSNIRLNREDLFVADQELIR